MINETPTTQPQTNASFCTWEDWRGYLPADLQRLSQAAWLRKSRDGEWAMYFRVGGQRSVAYFRRSDIVSWFELSFGAIRPDCIAALKASGFVPAKVPGSQSKQKRKRTAGARNV